MRTLTKDTVETLIHLSEVEQKRAEVRLQELYKMRDAMIATGSDTYTK